jgi:ABC-2 type transport system ATP-binding protein
MSIEVAGLSKVYGQRKAVDNVSFSLRPGEIAGFLGPNGAGKSTTFKILTGLIPATSGSATVCGFNPEDGEVTRCIGYLPEHNPLYLDMFVHEFLEFAGRVHGLKGAFLRKRIGEMVDMCGIEPEQNKKLEALSKGYRQRVGLAQALLHEPKVLILDEPTTGLDPNQLVEIRQLIKSISSDKTVIFSTHIMQEVEALCDRVLVINQGQLVADDSLSSILARHSAHPVFIAEFDKHVEVEVLKGITGVDAVEVITGNLYRLRSQPGIDLRSHVFRFAAEGNLSLLGLRREETSLEAVFKSLTHQQVLA